LDNQRKTKHTYKIIRNLGKGSFGVTYEVVDDQSQQSLALKHIDLPEKIDDITKGLIIHQFQQSAKVAETVKHSSLAAVLHSGEIDSKPYIAYELYKGITIRNYLKYEETIPSLQLRELACQLLSALAAIHKSGLVHGHIYPQNMLMHSSDSYILLDFGLYGLDEALRQHVPDYKPTISAYTSPELAQTRNPDARSDIFSVAASLYECLTGKPAFYGNTENEMIEALTNVEPVDICHISPEWNTILKKALSKDPAKRYQNATQMLNSIQAQVPSTVIVTQESQHTLPQNTFDQASPIQDESLPDSASNKKSDTIQDDDTNVNPDDIFSCFQYMRKYIVNHLPAVLKTEVSIVSLRTSAYACVFLMMLLYPMKNTSFGLPSWIVHLTIGGGCAVIAAVSLRNDLKNRK